MGGLLKLFILAGSGVLSTQACNVTAAEQCRTDFLSQSDDLITEHGPFYTEEQLIDLCANVEPFVACTEPVTDGCTAGEIADLQIDILIYTCSETSRDQQTARTVCLTSPTLEPDASMCFTNTTYNLFTFAIDNGTACDAMEEFAGCTLDVVERECKKDTASWYAGLFDAQYAYIKERYDCEFSAADFVSMATTTTDVMSMGTTTTDVMSMATTTTALTPSLVFLVATLVMASMRG